MESKQIKYRGTRNCGTSKRERKKKKEKKNPPTTNLLTVLCESGKVLLIQKYLCTTKAYWLKI